MIAEIVNLRQARKQRARREREAQAQKNRAAFGVSKAKREAGGAETRRAAAALERSALSDEASAPTGDPGIVS